jgi:hypothetical protein
MQNFKRVRLSGLLLTVCLLMLVFSSWGYPPAVQAKTQAGVSVGGIVYDWIAQAGAAGVFVRLDFDHFGGTPQYSATTDSNGFFTFTNIPPGSYVIIPFPPAGYIGSGFSFSVGTTAIDNLFLSLIKDIPLLSPPTGSFVEVPHPWLCWEGMPQAISYWIQVNRKSDWFLINNPHVFNSACYWAEGPFVNGVEYSWQVASALNAQGFDIGSTGNAFRFTYKTDPVNQAINQGGHTLLNSWDGTIQFDFPPGSLAGAGTITYQRNNQPPGAYTRSGIGKAYDLSSTSALASDATYSVTITYTDMDDFGIKSGTLALYAWDSGLSQWVKEPSSQLNAANHTITASPNHLSTWAVLGDADWIFLPAVRK